ncbi:MAG: DUF512 domain-containing protein [Peptococcaceae bacterium]|nr:DUF512 domain-containing protein [Peptococcaceae bacterium]
MKNRGLAVFQVEPGSIAEELGLEPGDRIVSVNGEPVRDIIDYRFLETEESLTVEVKKAGGEEWVLDIEKDFDQGLGLDFGPEGFGRTIRCRNKCVFCFVDQMPPGLRKTLYIKDDDYRLSFWSGNFITLTNLGDGELHRIAAQRLSPLYISVHTTNGALREKMLGNSRAGLIMEQLRYLAGAGIEMHTQAVLCPGLNDGEELARTADDLAGLWPAVRSLAVVPVGLTRFRQGLYPLRAFGPDEARRLLRWAGARQEEFLRGLGYPFLFASDEFYLLCGEPVPPAERYADFPQTENGVGLVRLFLDEWEEVRGGLPRQVAPMKATLATGVLAEALLRPVAARLNGIKGLAVTLKVIENRFFGSQVTVAGLITGGDLLAQIRPGEAGDLLVLPSVTLKEEEAVFLDGLTVQDLSRRLETKVAVADGPRQLLEVLLAARNG